LNQTQKAAYFEKRHAIHVLETSRRMELLGLLLRGKEFHSDYEQIGPYMLFDQAVEDAESGLRLRSALATSMHMHVTTGKLTEDADRLVTVTHGLHLGFDPDERIQSRRCRWICGATRAQLENIFQASSKVQGKHFRDAKMHGDAELRRRAYSDAHGSFEHVTLTAEEGGEHNLRVGLSPVFFVNGHGVGPQDPEGLGIDLRRDELRGQVIRAMRNGLIGTMVLGENGQ
jgi:hypothetical protein